MLVLEKHHRVVAANRGSKQSRGVTRVRWEHDANARAMREDRDARLAVVRGAAAQVAADWHAHDHRAAPVVVRPVPHHRHLVAELHVAGPDIVEELDLDDRLDAAQRHADGAADDVRLGKRRVEDALASVQLLEPVRHFEDASLAGHLRERALAARIRHVLAEDDDARVARHLVAQRRVDRGHHRVGRAAWSGFGLELGGRGIDGRREHVAVCGVGSGLGSGERLLRGRVDLPLDIAKQLRELLGGCELLR
jgi:hypothetical protein